MVYLLIFCFLVFCIYAYDYKKHSRGSIVAYVLVCVFLIAVAGLRYRLGGDSVIYEQYYRGIPPLDQLSQSTFQKNRWEPGFVFLMSLTRTGGSDFTLFQIIHAIILNGVVFWFFYKNTKNKFIGVTLYYVCLYVNLNMEVMREALAVSLFLLSWPFFRDGRWIYYYILIAIACTFHISATVCLFLPLFVIPGIRSWFKLSWKMWAVCIVLFIVGMVVQKKFYAIIQLLSINQTFTERAQAYEEVSFGGARLNLFGMVEHFIRQILIPVVALYYMRLHFRVDDQSEKYKYFRRLEIIVVVGIYFATLTMQIFIAGRLNNYFGFFNYLLVASCFFTKFEVRYHKYKLPGYLWSTFLSIILLLNVVKYFNPAQGQNSKVYMLYYPYSSRLEPQEDPDREQIIRLNKYLK